MSIRINCKFARIVIAYRINTSPFCKSCTKLGARFTKWRGVYSISNNYPSKLAINSNAHALARYAALVQECEMVPIVEPEVLMDGDHSAE